MVAKELLTHGILAPKLILKDAAIQNRFLNPYAQFYPDDWPANPFHEGEIKLQQQAGVQEKVMSYAPKVVRPYIPEQHRDFYEAQPFLVAAARDKDGNMWTTLLVSPTGQADLTRSPDPKILQISGAPVQGDALEGVLAPGTDLGLLGIEFATKRRNRVNGRITASDSSGMMTFSTDQSFGNCPQYIKPRQWWTAKPQESSSSDGDKRLSQVSPRHSDKLSEDQMKKISAAETIFTATGYRGQGRDVRFGNDASHRGGPAGFVIVQDSKTIILPEFAGNNHFNSMGNLQMDPRMGLTIPSFEDGGLLQLSGRGQVDMDQEKAAKTFSGALRRIIFHVEQVNEIPAGSLPIRWSIQAEAEQRQLQITSIIQESADVKSFHMNPLPQDNQSLWDFNAGQHLPIQLRSEDGELLRTYSLSGSPNAGEYRISVKHEPFGKASSFLHNKVKVGDVLNVTRPGGDFVLPDEQQTMSGRTLVLLSSGIGVTPILSMLHRIVDSGAYKGRKVYWIQGVRDGKHHPFRGEVQMLQQAASPDAIKIHIVYSRPLPEDEATTYYNSQGHVTVDLLESVVDDDLTNVEYFMCGSGAFMADMEDGLQAVGVDSRHIHFETF